MWLEGVEREGWFTRATQTQMQAVFIRKANANTGLGITCTHAHLKKFTEMECRSRFTSLRSPRKRCSRAKQMQMHVQSKRKERKNSLFSCANCVCMCVFDVHTYLNLRACVCVCVARTKQAIRFTRTLQLMTQRNTDGSAVDFAVVLLADTFKRLLFLLGKK